tara:strand:+ start:7158 stop:8840 length:1683 start_codon:yes stop_codon:yes gene_type:complete
LDISARSALRLSKYELATKKYRVASKYGLSLRDHNINHFNAELRSGYLENAYSIMRQGTGDNYDGQLDEIIRSLKKLNENERVKIIQSIGKSHKIPEVIAELLPWKPKKIEVRKDSDESYYMLSSELLEVDRYRREISRIKQSGAYRLMNHITDSIRSPKKIILLPFSFIKLGLSIVNQRRGKIDNSVPNQFPIGNGAGSRNCIVFFPTNGVGFGHFTRLLSLAKKIREKDEDIEIIFFTTMPTLHILAEEGFPAYHISGRYRYNEMPPKIWNSLCEEMLNMVLSLHRPKAFVFDGSYPYRGMLNAIQSHQTNMLKVWLRRGAIKANSKSIPVDSINHFHAIIRPGDSVESDFGSELDHGTAVIQCNPIMLTDSDNMASKGDLRNRLGIPLDSTLCYIQLGAGNINDIDSELSWTIKALEKHPEIYIVIGESMLGDRLSSEYKRVRILRDYPNSRYFSDFDFAILAGGYNSYHEAIEASIPTICYPNMKTGRDDQLARAMVAEDAGCMVVLKNRTENKIQIAIDRISELEVREMMKSNFSILHRANGSNQVADWILEQIN